MALLGKPNVGKSSLLNKLSGESRSVVDAVAGTTIDPVDSLVELDGQVWRFVDTAGLRRRVNQAKGMEFYASLRTQTALEAAEVAIVLIDSSVPLTEQDQRVITMVIESGRALVIAMNKADLVDADRREEVERELSHDLVAGRPGRERINISAQTGRGVHRLAPAMAAGAELLGPADPDRSAELLARRADPGDAAAGAQRQAAEGAVRHPGREPAADVRAVHQRVPGGRVPPVHRAPVAGGLRLHRLAGAGQRPGPGEARRSPELGRSGSPPADLRWVCVSREVRCRPARRPAGPGARPSVAIIGAGDRGSRYARILTELELGTVVGIAEPIDERRLDVASSAAVPPEGQFRDWRDMLARPRFADAVVVSTRDDRHHEPTIAALQAGYHVLVEKPMATTEAEASEMVRTAERTGRILAVCHVLRYTAYTKVLRELIDAGTVGDIVSVEHSNRWAGGTTPIPTCAGTGGGRTSRRSC